MGRLLATVVGKDSQLLKSEMLPPAVTPLHFSTERNCF